MWGCALKIISSYLYKRRSYDVCTSKENHIISISISINTDQIVLHQICLKNNKMIASLVRASCYVIAGIQGPVIVAQAGNRVVVHFKNLASQPYSISPVGITYWKQSEGKQTNGKHVPPTASAAQHSQLPGQIMSNSLTQMVDSWWDFKDLYWSSDEEMENVDRNSCKLTAHCCCELDFHVGLFSILWVTTKRFPFLRN